MKNKAYIVIDDARPTYPVFYLSPQNSTTVEIDATPANVRRWTKAAALYAQAQKEIELLVNNYQPAAIRDAEVRKMRKERA